jgi:hypothetical protein
MSTSFVLRIVIVWSMNSSNTSQYGNETNIFQTSNLYNVNYYIKYPHYDKIKEMGLQTYFWVTMDSCNSWY